jgi:hypothetical protein
MSCATRTIRTALVLSRPTLLTNATRVGLEGWRRVLSLEPNRRLMHGRWGVLPDAPLPDLVVAEHANPLLVAMLCADLLRRSRLLEAPIAVLLGERDDALRQLLAPLPLPLTVIGSTALRRAYTTVSDRRAMQLGVRWEGLAPPRSVLPRWQLVPLIPALARAPSVAFAAEWCGMSRSTAYSILAISVRHLHLSRRWRSSRQWSRDLLVALSYPRP